MPGLSSPFVQPFCIPKAIRRRIVSTNVAPTEFHGGPARISSPPAPPVSRTIFFVTPRAGHDDDAKRHGQHPPPHPPPHPSSGEVNHRHVTLARHDTPEFWLLAG